MGCMLWHVRNCGREQEQLESSSSDKETVLLLGRLCSQVWFLLGTPKSSGGGPVKGSLLLTLNFAASEWSCGNWVCQQEVRQ